MLFGQLAAPAAPPPSTWERVKGYAGEFEELIDAPVTDLAAVISVDAAWLGGLLLGLKFISSGFFLMRTKSCPVPRR